MTPKEALAMLSASFRDKELTRETINVYVKHLSAISPASLKAAVTLIVSTSRFFPSIAEIRQAAATACGLMPMGVEEALAIVRQSDRERPVFRRDGTPAYVEREWVWPEDLPEEDLAVIRAALHRVGESVDVDGRRVFGWEQAFKAAYERISGVVVSALDLSVARPRALPPVSARALQGRS